MIIIKKWDAQTSLSKTAQANAVNFLYENLQQYGDPKQDIEKAVMYALNQTERETSGFVLVATIDEEIVGVTVVNETGMKDYIPENILVYIATHQDYRGKGIGMSLMQNAIESSEGNIALHVEPDNPARKLYEKLGFTNKYLEMRYIK
ncbi:GNAT family N-acetyltransferase [Myroides ceti]|uniref:GNAT family N-acetyltransferase n=2 Tax=Paenimyroides ceti TaxID=395087 RepID=A0ABT8CRH7_9FLAO|nr:GNAT family N-acetyltransferase [Paenimyroides ceti]MDN3706371.1 GNAT family N-acetyltransferase [Paenimyroides ceti]